MRVVRARHSMLLMVSATERSPPARGGLLRIASRGRDTVVGRGPLAMPSTTTTPPHLRLRVLPHVEIRGAWPRHSCGRRGVGLYCTTRQSRLPSKAERLSIEGAVPVLALMCGTDYLQGGRAEDEPVEAGTLMSVGRPRANEI
jgi:hypothetical protein